MGYHLNVPAPYLPHTFRKPSANLPPLREFEKCVFASSCYQANYETRIGLATIMKLGHRLILTCYLPRSLPHTFRIPSALTWVSNCSHNRTGRYTNDRIRRYTKNTSAYLPPDGPVPSANLPHTFHHCENRVTFAFRR